MAAPDKLEYQKHWSRNKVKKVKNQLEQIYIKLWEELKRGKIVSEEEWFLFFLEEKELTKKISRVPLIPKSIAYKTPHLIHEWHSTMNKEKNPCNISNGSGLKVWWTCQRGHTYDLIVRDRTQKNGAQNCPYCAGKRVSNENSLGAMFPELISDWHPTLNGELTPFDFTHGSNKIVWWKCPEGHDYDSKVVSRTKGNGCRFCSGNDINFETSLATTHPDIAAQWHLSLNGSLKPTDVRCGSVKKVWWFCDNNHTYERSIYHRSQRNQGCPYCSGRKLLPNNSLAAKNTKLSLEWHPIKNGTLSPWGVHSNSTLKVWWLCRKNHEWEANINNRNNGNGCYFCSFSTQSSFPEQAIYFYIKQIYPDAENKYKLKYKGKTLEVDIFIPSLDLCIEYDGYYHKREVAIIRDKKKNTQLLELGKKVIRARIKYLPDIEQSDVHVLYREDEKSNESLEKCVQELFKYIQSAYKDNEALKLKLHFLSINLERDQAVIYEKVANRNDSKSLKIMSPEITKDWHPNLNGNLQPEDVSYGSEMKVWWMCENGHSFRSRISNRLHGNGCPECSNLKRTEVTKENCLAAKCPKISLEWHPVMNQNTTPFDVRPTSSYKAWWRCKNNHEFQASVRGRYYHSGGCKRCSYDRKVEKKQLKLETIKRLLDAQVGREEIAKITNIKLSTLYQYQSELLIPYQK
ncbi:zinc-ribbon domain-containing protein [Paenibacillus sp. 2TAB26]|uniref:zinc-ribbon domain-containing protein n=1 Tax=Paenibacillus sp. 2TAB26 TaxID=3233005 RepID=UPI003F989924